VIANNNKRGPGLLGVVVPWKTKLVSLKEVNDDIRHDDVEEVSVEFLKCITPNLES
jgi:hypothetical protein